MKSDPVLRQYKQRRERFYERLEEERRQGDAVLEELQKRFPTVSDTQALEELLAGQEKLLGDYLEGSRAFVDHVVNVELANRRPEVAEKRPKQPRSQAKIEQLSDELSTRLRLERVDDAAKELLDFLADAEFFAANATVGRKRRLRSVQNAIEKALAK